MSEQPVRTQFDPGGHQVVEITVHRGYQPDSIRASAGVPLRIVFWREDDDACSERVVFSNPRLDHRLSATGATTIDLPAQPPGEIRFTCGMGRYRGHIEIVDDRRAAIVARLRRDTGLLGPHLGTALVMLGSSLLAGALLVLLGLDAWAAIRVAGAALVALLAGCLWAFRSSTHQTETSKPLGAARHEEAMLFRPSRGRTPSGSIPTVVASAPLTPSGRPGGRPRGRSAAEADGATGRWPRR